MPDSAETSLESPRVAKAGRVQVSRAADRILRAGRRPTVEAIRAELGGGSPNAVVAYLNEWYSELGERLAAVEQPLAAVPAEASALLQALWRLAAKSRGVGPVGEGAAGPSGLLMLEAERDAFRAQVGALGTLNQELQRHRGSAERSLAEARALLSRREALLEDERAIRAQIEHDMARVRMELEVLRERRAVGVPVVRAAARKKKKGKGKRGLVTRKAGNKASGAVKSSSKTTRKIPRGRVRRSRSKGRRR